MLSYGGLRPSEVVHLTIPDPAEQAPLVARSVTPPSPSGRGGTTLLRQRAPRSCTVFVMTPPNEHTSEGGRDDRGVPYHAESALSSAQVLKVYCWQIKTQSSHRITAGGKRRVAIPGVLVAGHPVQRGMDANLGSLDRVYEALAASRWWQRLWNQATEMVRGYGCSRGSRHAPTLHEPKGCARGRHSNPGTCWAPHSV